MYLVVYLDIGKITGLGQEHSKRGMDMVVDKSLSKSRCKVRSMSCAGKSLTQMVEVSVLSTCTQATGANKHGVLPWGFWGPYCDNLQ